MASDEAKRLRAEVQRRLRSVNNKIARTKRTSGANIAGTEFDPRRRTGIEKNYNAKQLRGYLENLNQFMQRSNQFVAGAKGAPLRKGYFQRVYKPNEALHNQVLEQHDRIMSQVKTPSGMSVREYAGVVPQAGGASNYGPYTKFNREPGDIKNQRALEKLNADMVRMLKPQFMEGKVQQGKENLEKAILTIGKPELIDAMNELSDFQFEAMWFGSNFAEAVFQKYDLMNERKEGTRKEKWQDKIVDSEFDELGTVLSYYADPANVPTERP